MKYEPWTESIGIADFPSPYFLTFTNYDAAPHTQLIVLGMGSCVVLFVDEDVVEQEQERQFNRQHISLETHG